MCNPRTHIDCPRCLCLCPPCHRCHIDLDTSQWSGKGRWCRKPEWLMRGTDQANRVGCGPRRKSRQWIWGNLDAESFWKKKLGRQYENGVSREIARLGHWRRACLRLQGWDMCMRARGRCLALASGFFFSRALCAAFVEVPQACRT